MHKCKKGSTAEAISYTVEFVSRERPFSTEAQIELSYTVGTGLFRLNFFRLRIPTGGSSRKTQSKNRSHRSSHHQTHTHTAVSYKALTLAWLSLLLLFAASQRGAVLVPLDSSVYHTTAAARGIDPMLPTTAAPAVALAALG